MKFWSIEGNSQRLDGGAMFGNAPRALWERWITPDERHRIPLACRGLLVDDVDGKRVLFETGIGAFFDPKLRDRFGVVDDGHVLLDNLAAAGIPHDEVDVVVLSHLHFDHAGGLLTPWREDGTYELLFPKATFVVGEEAWRRAQDPHPRDRASFVPALNRLLADSGRLELVSGDTTPSLGDAVRFITSDGHTPGLLLGEVGGTLFCGDLIPGRPWVHVPITMGYDRFPELLIDEKTRVLADVVERGTKLFFTHDHGCSMCSVARDEKGRYGPAEEWATLDGLEIVTA